MKKNKKIPKFKNKEQENAEIQSLHRPDLTVRDFAEIGSLRKLYPFAKVRPLQV